MTMKYKTLYIDPPWMERGGGKIKRGADKHYPLLSTRDIISLLTKELKGKVNDHCHLYLWTTNNFLPDGFKVITALEFRYITCITWMKEKIGLGQYFRGITEQCLFAVKGRLPYKIVDGKRQQGVTGFIEKKGKHSKKPIKMIKMIERVSYPPFLEIFARNKRNGWDTIGNEIDNQTILN